MPRWRVPGSEAHRREMRAQRALDRYEYDVVTRDKYWESDKSSTSSKKTYAIASEDMAMVKIGRTERIESRLVDLQAASPVRLVLIATVDHDIERRLHKVLVKHRRHGEWFELNEEFMAWIRRTMRLCQASEPDANLFRPSPPTPPPSTTTKRS